MKELWLGEISFKLSRLKSVPPSNLEFLERSLLRKHRGKMCRKLRFVFSGSTDEQTRSPTPKSRGGVKAAQTNSRSTIRWARSPASATPMQLHLHYQFHRWQRDNPRTTRSRVERRHDRPRERGAPKVGRDLSTNL